MKVTIREHGEYTIQYDTATRMFEALKGDEVVLSENTETCIIDKLAASEARKAKLARSTNFPINCIWNHYGTLHKCKITSVAEDGGLWLSYVDRDGKSSRTKESSSYSSHTYFQLTPQNEAILNDIIQKEKDIVSLRTKISNLATELKNPIDIEQLK